MSVREAKKTYSAGGSCLWSATLESRHTRERRRRYDRRNRHPGLAKTKALSAARGALGLLGWRRKRDSL
jgi:hypothetical protein